MDFLHPANAGELANIAQETGAEVLRSDVFYPRPLRCPSETGGWQLGDVDLSAHLSKYRDCEIRGRADSAGRGGVNENVYEAVRTALSRMDHC